ncbi:MAG: HD-GYP domain-containing protein [Candidatus Riflebacteria bacterium]|nr:HD-GYP domain-containing protein [Candidatus Riflebacteria bacterium]
MEIIEPFLLEEATIFTGYSKIGSCSQFYWNPGFTQGSRTSEPNFLLKGLKCTYDVEALLIRKDLFLRTPDSKDYLLSNFQITDIEDFEDIAGTADSLELLAENFPEIKAFTHDEEVMVEKINQIAAFDVMSGIISNIQRGTDIDAVSAREIAEKFIKDINKNPDAVANLLDIKSYDDYTFTHNINVATLSIIIGKEMQLDDESLVNLSLGALMHDVGKLKVPQSILNKEGRLSEEELNIVRKHAVLGYEVLRKSNDIPEVSRQISLQHHERHGGHGYPRKLKGNEISLFSRITAISDVYDALTTDRPFRNALAPYNAIKMILSQVESHFDPVVLKAFIRKFSLFPSGSLVELNDSSVALVLKPNSKTVLRPVVKIIKTPNGKILRQRVISDLMNEKNLYIVGPAFVETLGRDLKV